MPWVRFTEDFDWKPMPSVTIAYRTGQVALVTAACAKKAKDAGKTERAVKPGSKSNAGG